MYLAVLFGFGERRFSRVRTISAGRSPGLEENTTKTTARTRPMVRMVGQTLIARCVSANIGTHMFRWRGVRAANTTANAAHARNADSLRAALPERVHPRCRSIQQIRSSFFLFTYFLHPSPIFPRYSQTHVSRFACYFFPAKNSTSATLSRFL